MKFPQTSPVQIFLISLCVPSILPLRSCRRVSYISCVLSLFQHVSFELLNRIYVHA